MHRYSKDNIFLWTKILMAYKKKIAVIGGGFAGIGALASLVEEGCFDPICFERTSECAGTWCYREESTDGVASIMPTTILNHSKEIGAISNFPPNKEVNNFMKHEEFYQYITDYAKANDILKYIRYNSEVVSVKRSVDYNETGRWIVTVKDTISETLFSDIYDGVIVAVGHMNRPKMPNYPGQEKFKGHIMHTHKLKGVQQYQNKNVVVVGMGCSALDAAVEISNVTKQVYLSSRSGAHVLKRIGPKGYPYDYILLRPYFFQLFDIFPSDMISSVFESIYTDNYFHQKLFPVAPKHHIFSKDPVVNDQIGVKLLSGSIIQKTNIECFTEDGVIFEGDSKVTKADVVIMATGYTWKFPFLEEGTLIQEENKINLYKCIFPPHLPHATLAIIGFFLPFGPGIPAGELQSRWTAQVFAGKCKLPSHQEMMMDINKKYEINCSRYPSCEKISVRVDYISYCDDIAFQFGAKPNLYKLVFTDPSLFLKILFGPSLSYQYRLQGPHLWKGAREAIMTSHDRILYAITKKRFSGNSRKYF
ncbi:flavin-containing monooxygenase 5 [Caerostris extrusa]|uniref:Flavin-containing monooxygenase n=1 Tax=Caerostris extrusa TaxID=172846 RepID=A0AAV4WKR5_CAEEX|nr:flavin-containing monooxygenase 5 [Caerostris extrusa]